MKDGRGGGGKRFGNLLCSPRAMFAEDQSIHPPLALERPTCPDAFLHMLVSPKALQDT